MQHAVGAKVKHGLCWEWAGTEVTSVWVLETRQAFEAGAPGELLGRSVASASPEAHPTSGEPRPACPLALQGRCGHPAAGTGLPLLKAAFVRLLGAPVSLTLDPASYLSNSKRNSAAAEGKKITSAAELGGKRPSLASAGPTPTPGAPYPCTWPSQGPRTEPSLSQELWASFCSQRCVCGEVPGGSGTPTLSEAAGWVEAP